MVEVGCYRGATTIWLSKTLQALGARKQYFALDTFRGFTDTHIAHERALRGKATKEFESDFRYNSQTWFERTMELHGIDFVTSVRCDASSFAYSQLGPISFALIDVDLYLPMRAALRGTVPLLAKGGVIVVDDCRPEQKFDGAYQAYHECAAEVGVAPEIINGRFGVLRG